MYLKRTKDKKLDRNQTRVEPFQSRLGTFGKPLTTCLKGWGQKKRSPPFNTEVHRRRVLVGGGVGPPAENPFAPSFPELHFKRDLVHVRRDLVHLGRD